MSNVAKDQTITSNMVNVYCMEVSSEDGKTSTIPMEVSPDFGVHGEIFDEEIEHQNSVSECILWA